MEIGSKSLITALKELECKTDKILDLDAEESNDDADILEMQAQQPQPSNEVIYNNRRGDIEISNIDWDGKDTLKFRKIFIKEVLIFLQKLQFSN